MLYFAYGSNLDIRQMRMRCPKATALFKFTLEDARLVFRGVADCVFEPGSKCEGGLWRITPDCERALDLYEGVSGGLYRKEYFGISGMPETEFLIYQMNSTGVFPPSQGYLDCIKQGYRDFGLPLDCLRAAVKASYDDKAPSHIERQRHRRKGRPMLGKLPEPKRKAKAPSEPTLF